TRNVRPLLYRIIPALALSLVLPLAIRAQASRGQTAANPSARATGALKVITGQAGSVVFINNIRHGTTNDKGELDLPRVRAGSYTARVRTVGYSDWTGPVVIAAGASRVLKVTQQPTGDQATLHYQKGDALRDKGQNKDAVAEYQQAVALRPLFPEARIALARSLVTLQDFQESEKQIQAAIKNGGRTLPEAQTVLANLRRSQGLVEESIIEYRKALRLARGNSFEAHIGLAIALNEVAESRNNPRLIDEIAKEYRLGIAQDMETEPILYYQLGEILEKAGRNKEAIEAYRNYLRLDPEGEYASAVESVIEQLKQQPDRQEQN
ncbi:MAG TPA: tetratricopeptide repeat protein, partial [Blastocatellia bacterium]|nr:tetratricopeptide repeat protein [Blastocatellia bacterium]